MHILFHLKCRYMNLAILNIMNKKQTSNRFRNKVDRYHNLDQQTFHRPAHDRFVSIILIQFQVETCFMANKRTDPKNPTFAQLSCYVRPSINLSFQIYEVFSFLSLLIFNKIFSYPTCHGRPTKTRDNPRARIKSVVSINTRDKQTGS